MKLNLKTILIVVVAIVVLIVIFSFVSPKNKEDDTKKNEVNNLFAVWMNISGPGDKITLTQNEASIKKDLLDKLDLQEVASLKAYSLALNDMLNSKSEPWSVTFLNSIAYLAANFSTAKEIVSKTSASNVFSGLSNPGK